MYTDRRFDTGRRSIGEERTARMAREQAYADKRDAILDAAQRLVYTKGYEQMTIQDMLEALRISKGAFYHYFASKPALLDALLARMQEEVLALLRPIAHDAHLSALDKLRRFFPTLARWKTDRRDFMLELARVLYSDDNAIFRQKARARAITTVTPLLTEIIRQGVQEGVVSAAYPDEVGEMLVCLVLDLSDTLAGVLLVGARPGDLASRFERTVAAYTAALERVLSAPSGSLPIVDADTLKQWLIAPDDAGPSEARL
jgi:AcrR family transcriptional regulator